MCIRDRCWGEAHVAQRREGRAAPVRRPKQAAHARGPRMRQLLVIAAGTGGHVIPGLAVATEMQRRGWLVSWLGTQTGLENRLVPPTGIVLDRVSFTGLR